MTDLILSLIGAAWVFITLGFLLYIGVCIVVHHVLGDGDEFAGEYAEFDDDADEFDGDAWDRARDIEQDRRWEIAS